jgi:hypothetical protein
LAWTGDGLADLKLVVRYFVEFCADDLARYQLLFQRTIPGFEPSEEAFAPSIASLAELAERLDASGLGGPGRLDLLTAIGTGLAAQQLSNDPGGDRWLRLLDEAMEMFFDHVNRTPVRPPARRPR